MTDGHSILTKAWDEKNAAALLVLADWLDEQGIPDEGDHLRLTAEDVAATRHCPKRAAALRTRERRVRVRLRNAG